MAGIPNNQISNILNATTPTGTAGIPGTFTALSTTSAMKVRLNSGISSASAAGTEIANGGGYTTGGQAVTAASTASSSGSAVTLPASTALTWTNSSGSQWSIQSFDLTDQAGTRAWFGNFTGAPVLVASGNSFSISTGGISIGLG